MKSFVDEAADDNVEDNTAHHLSNMHERYQILPDKILYLSGEWGEDGVLYQTDRKGKHIKVVAREVWLFVEYKNEIYYSQNAGLYKFNPDNRNKECLLEKGVTWFTVYEDNILIIGGESIYFYNMQKKTTEMYVEHYPYGFPFYAGQINDYIILCDSNVRLYSLKQKCEVLLLERGELTVSDDAITVCENKAYIKMQRYYFKGIGKMVFTDSEWNGIWCLDLGEYEESEGEKGFEMLSDEQVENLLASGEISSNAGIFYENGKLVKK